MGNYVAYLRQSTTNKKKAGWGLRRKEILFILL